MQDNEADFGRISACNQDQGITEIPEAPLPALPPLLPVSTYYTVFFGLTHEVEWFHENRIFNRSEIKLNCRIRHGT